MSDSQETNKRKMEANQRRPGAHLQVILLVLIWLLLGLAAPAATQYGGGGGYEMGSPGGYSGTGYNYAGADERPKLHLGIRLRIPAFKVDLPRFSLPKITVSAKIRQPDRPRTITLPEINLDTTSKIAPPSSGGGDYSHAGSNYRHSSSHSGGGERTQTLTFSTQAEEQPNNYAPINHDYDRPERHQQQQQQQQQQISYSGSQLSPQYVQLGPSNNRPHLNLNQADQQQLNEAQNPELGFNQPAFVQPQEAASSLEAPEILSQAGEPIAESISSVYQAQQQQQLVYGAPFADNANQQREQPVRRRSIFSLRRWF